MALVESSQYEQEEAAARANRASAAPPVRLQRGGFGKLAIALVGAGLSGGALWYAVVTSDVQVPGSEILLAMDARHASSLNDVTPDKAAPIDEAQSTERTLEDDVNAARQLAFLADGKGQEVAADKIPPVMNLNDAEGLTSQEVVAEIQPPASEKLTGTDHNEVLALASVAGDQKSLEVEKRVPRPRLKPGPVQDLVQQGPAQQAKAPSPKPFADELNTAQLNTVKTRPEVAGGFQKAAMPSSKPSPGMIVLNTAPWVVITQRSPNGLLPVIGPQGEVSRDYYARPFASHDARPRISLVIGGLGLSQKATTAAIDNLPPDVTLAFAPYGKNLQSWINKARGRGHEVMLELPMEPFDYPTNDPGPFTLLTNNDVDQNTQRLEWLLAQFSGYIGVTNYLGAKFTSTPQALAPVLRQLDGRGLMILDDGSSTRSLIPSLSRKFQIPWAQAARTIDLRVSRAAIDDALLDLERVASKEGAAIGMGFAYPVTIDRILSWVAQLEQKGFVLAPVSANIHQDKSAPARRTSRQETEDTHVANY